MITIRRVQPSESSLYREIRLKALKEDPYAFGATYESALQRTEEEWKNQTEKSAQGSTQAIFIAFEGDKPVGLSAVYKDKEINEEAEVFQVWVCSSHRGKGLGNKIMDTVFEWSEQNEYERLIATVSNTNQKALGFYLKYGFNRRSESDGEVKMTKETKSNKTVLTIQEAARPES